MWLNLIVLVLATVISYLLRPEVKQENPSFDNMEDPVADAGMPIPVVFGTMQVKRLNVIWWGEKERTERRLAVDKK